MLFLLKRNWQSALIGLSVLTALGLVLRLDSNSAPPFIDSPVQILYGLIACLAILAIDGALHLSLSLLVGEPFLRRWRELAAVFRDQRLSAILMGAVMAGIGEELLFRGLSTSLLYLLPATLIFGLLHHIRRSLWPFTLWAILEGLLFVLVLEITGALIVTMVAHFLHDLGGFLLFRVMNRQWK